MLKIKLFGFIVFFSYIFNLNSQNNNYISIKIDAYEGKQSILYSVKGSRYFAIDTVVVTNGVILHKLTQPLLKGGYTVYVNDTLTLDIISDNKGIEMSTKLPEVIGNMKVIKSEENKVYYDYLKYYYKINDSIEQYRSDADMIKAINGGSDTPQSEELRKKAENFKASIRNYTLLLIENYPDLFVSKILKGGLMPDYMEYIKKPGAVKYNNIRSFYAEHFFDNIDFEDANLLRTRVIYTAVGDYITNFADPPSENAYIKAIDFILNKSTVNTEVYEYILELLLTTFGSSPWEGVYVHLVENYLLKDGCGLNIDNQVDLQARAEAMQKLLPGNNVPEINLSDTNGKTISVYDVNASYTVLFFWNTACEHCERAVPKLKELYEKYHTKGFEIYAIAITPSADVWKQMIIQQNSPWINVSDIKGRESPLMTQFNLWSTPSFFILNKDKQILERPFNVESIDNFLLNTLR